MQPYRKDTIGHPIKPRQHRGGEIVTKQLAKPALMLQPLMGCQFASRFDHSPNDQPNGDRELLGVQAECLQLPI